MPGQYRNPLSGLLVVRLILSQFGEEGLKHGGGGGPGGPGGAGGFNMNFQGVSGGRQGQGQGQGQGKGSRHAKPISRGKWLLNCNGACNSR